MKEHERELADAERQGQAAHAAMDAWLNRAVDAPETPAALLEEYARELRESRARIRRIADALGQRDEIERALVRNAEYHRSLGLSIKDETEGARNESED